VALGVSVGCGVKVSVGGDVGVLGVKTMMTGVTLGGSVLVHVAITMIGVAVITPGVRVGMGVHTGKGCGATFQISQAVRRSAHNSTAPVFFMRSIILFQQQAFLPLVHNLQY